MGNEESTTSEDGYRIEEADRYTDNANAVSLIDISVGRDSKERASKPSRSPLMNHAVQTLLKEKTRLAGQLNRNDGQQSPLDEREDVRDMSRSQAVMKHTPRAVDDFSQKVAEQQPCTSNSPTKSDFSPAEKYSRSDPHSARGSLERPTQGAVKIAFDRMRPRRIAPEIATITIGPRTTTSVLGSPSISKQQEIDSTPSISSESEVYAAEIARHDFGSSVRAFAAPGSQLVESVSRPQSKSRISRSIWNSTLGDGGGSRDRLAYEIRKPSEEQDEEQIIVGTASDGGFGSDTPNSPSYADSDEDHLDEADKKAKEEAKVVDLIRQAEEKAALPSQDTLKHAHRMLKGGGQKASTVELIQILDTSVERIDTRLGTLETTLHKSVQDRSRLKDEVSIEGVSPEESLSLTVSKKDFAQMHVIGQFNLGFVLASRNNTDLFIIDQHASDEKFNFERLQAATVVQNQRLVQPRTLHLTAIEEEIILENNGCLLKNGFLVDIDTSGDQPVGQRCKLTSLPMSHEVTFDITDLEELIALLSENHSSGSTIRPSKVRRMFAMRACRSSVMIGKTLTMRQMSALVKRMGEIDKPWNCPHGRPTMRHGKGLVDWNSWHEGDGLRGMEQVDGDVDWARWIIRMKERQASFDEKEGSDQEAELLETNEDEGEVEEEVEEVDGNETAVTPYR